MFTEAMRQVLPYTHLGWQLFSTVFFFIGVGWLLDKFLGTSPYAIIVLSIIGICVGLYSVLKSAQQISKKS